MYERKSGCTFSEYVNIFPVIIELVANIPRNCLRQRNLLIFFVLHVLQLYYSAAIVVHDPLSGVHRI